jgi:mono/diheme cytochrome c family protein
MTNRAQRNLRLRKSLFAALLVLICVSISVAVYQHNQQWVVPESAKQRVNPLHPTESNLHSARLIYQEDCANCHGNSGKGDGPESKLHDPLPADLTNPKATSSLTDGEIFYQITEGRRPMPSFKSRLTEDQRWQLVLLVRSFSAAKSQPTASLVRSPK